jgi:hypothetical protein
MTIQKRGDGCCTERIIDAVRFMVSRDGGKSWKLHAGGQYYKTGQSKETVKDAKIKFEIDPPIMGATNVQVLVDKDHVNNGWMSARFDLWAKKE